MLKVNKSRVEVMGSRTTTMAELSVLIDCLAERDYDGTLIAIMLGLKDHNNNVGKLLDKLDDYLEDNK